MTTPVPVLEARGVSFSYTPAVPIVSDWSAHFPAGSMVALTGASGKGKSTLLYLLGLMLRPAAGEVLVDGVPASRLPDAATARLRAGMFGFVFQDAALDATRTVLDNVIETALYRGEPRASATSRALGLLERFGVELRAQHTPGQVSGGQAQRIALSRALLNSPRILLADEPTGNLDPTSTRVVVDALHEHAATGAAVIIVTHDPAIAARCDERIEL